MAFFYIFFCLDCYDIPSHEQYIHSKLFIVLLYVETVLTFKNIVIKVQLESQNFDYIENWLNIKKVMIKNVS